MSACFESKQIAAISSRSVISLLRSRKSITPVNYLSRWQQKPTWFSVKWTSNAVYFNDLFETFHFFISLFLFIAKRKKKKHRNEMRIFNANLCTEEKTKIAENGFLNGFLYPKSPSQPRTCKHDIVSHSALEQIIDLFMNGESRVLSHDLSISCL